MKEETIFPTAVVSSFWPFCVKFQEPILYKGWVHVTPSGTRFSKISPLKSKKTITMTFNLGLFCWTCFTHVFSSALTFASSQDCTDLDCSVSLFDNHTLYNSQNFTKGIVFPDSLRNRLLMLHTLRPLNTTPIRQPVHARAGTAIRSVCQCKFQKKRSFSLLIFPVRLSWVTYGSHLSCNSVRLCNVNSAVCGMRGLRCLKINSREPTPQR